MTRIYREESCRFRVFHVQVDRVEDLGCRVLSSPFFFFWGGVWVQGLGCLFVLVFAKGSSFQASGLRLA